MELVGDKIMELSGDKLLFKVMVTFPSLLEERIKVHNKLYHTDFKIIEIIDDEAFFCLIEVTVGNASNIFDLGYGLAMLQYSLREKGEISW